MRRERTRVEFEKGAEGSIRPKRPKSHPIISSFPLEEIPLTRLPETPHTELKNITAIGWATGLRHSFSQLPLVRPQAKLTLSQPGDAYEEEADRVADLIVSTPEPSFLPPSEVGIHSAKPQERSQRDHEERGESKPKENLTQLKEGARSPISANPLVSEAMQTSGQPLEAPTRAFMEPRFGFEFSQVRIHSDAQAMDAAESMNASAFTLGNDIAFARGRYVPDTSEGRHLLAHELTHVVQQARSAPPSERIYRDPQPDAATTPSSSITAAATGVPRAEDLVVAKYPRFAGILTLQQYKVIQDVINWRWEGRKLRQEIVDFDKGEREKAHREGMRGDSYRYLSSYNRKLDRLQNKQNPPPEVTEIGVDTSKLIDRSILSEQEWNIQAEKEFRESWVVALSSKPTILELLGDHPIENVFRGVYWNGATLPTENGLITWKTLLEIPEALADYNSRVRLSPVAQAARQNLKQLHDVYNTAESEYNLERERKGEFPVVSAISEFFSSSIDWNAASKLLPKGKSFENMDPIEIAGFLGSLSEEQLDRVSRILPARQDVMKIYNHLLNINIAVDLGKYEAALITMPLVADEIEEMYRKTMTYRQRTVEGAATVVTGLQAVRTGCNIVLTIGGGVAGKAYGLIGISAGSAAGAGIGTLTQETAMQLSEGQFKPGSILLKTGKDAALTFVSSMIGGALGSKFASILGPKLAPIIPNVAVRSFVIGRIADIGSSLITSPIQITLDGMLEGDWPKNIDDLLNRVAENAITDVIVGGSIDIITGIPNLKGKAWDTLTEPDVSESRQLGHVGEQTPFTGVTDEAIDAALAGPVVTGTMVQAPVGQETGRALVDVQVVSRLNDQVRALVAGRGTSEPPTGAAFARSEIEVAIARKIIANPNSPPEAVNQALEVVVERAVADYRSTVLHRVEGSTAETVLTADELRGACGVGRDVTADSIASLTIGSRVPIVVYRIQAAHLGIDARHSFTVILTPDGQGYLVDPTFAQFADQISGSTFSSGGMLSDPRAVEAARNLLRDGFVPLNAANAYDYALGLGARPEQAPGVAARIVSGDAAVLTEVVMNGTVNRASLRPEEAYNTMKLPYDIETPSAGTIHDVEQILARLGPDDPARPGLASLRNRLIMIAAEQQSVTPEGIGRRPSGR